MLTSILRTVVPALWGSAIGWLLTMLPILEPLREQLLTYGDWAVPFIAAILIGGWYALWRKLEPRLPDWLTAILLGSAKTPTYWTKDTLQGELVADGELTADYHEANRPKHSAQ